MARVKHWRDAAGFTAFLVWSGPACANAPRLGGGGGLDLSLTRIVISLLLCLGIAVSVIILLKRNGGRIDPALLRGLLRRGPAGVQRIQVIESRRISAHADLCLVRCDDTEYVVLCSAQQQQLLREQPVLRSADA